jgi:LL-H family phage holin
MTIDLTDIIKAVVTLLGFIITGFVIPLIKSKITEQQYNNLLKWAKAGVLAAEQLWPEGGMGQEKKAYVKQYLKDKGYDIDLQEVNIAIESAVFEMKKLLEDG